MTPFIFHWKNGLLDKHSAGGWTKALVDLDGEYLFPRDAMKDIRLHLKPFVLSALVTQLILGEETAIALERTILFGIPGKSASSFNGIDGLIHTIREF